MQFKMHSAAAAQDVLQHDPTCHICPQNPPSNYISATLDDPEKMFESSTK